MGRDTSWIAPDGDRSLGLAPSVAQALVSCSRDAPWPPPPVRAGWQPWCMTHGGLCLKAHSHLGTWVSKWGGWQSKRALG